MRHPRGTLPIRRWLALALAGTLFVPVLATTIVAFTQFGPPKHTTGQAADLLRSGAARWNDPAWQTATRQTLASRGIDFVLLQNGRTIYGSRRDLMSGTDAGNGGTVERLVIPGRPQRIAYISSGPWGGAGGIWLLPVVGFGTLVLTLAARPGTESCVMVIFPLSRAGRPPQRGTPKSGSSAADERLTYSALTVSVRLSLTRCKPEDSYPPRFTSSACTSPILRA